MSRMPATAALISAVALVAAGLAGQTGSAQSSSKVDDLIAKNLRAKGGLEKLRAVQTSKQISHMTVQGMDGTLTMYGRRPNLTRQEISVSGQVIINAFDGTTPWLINPLTGSSAPIIISGPQADAIRDQSDFDGPLVDYRTKGYTIELVGLETMNGKKVQHLKLTGKNKPVQHCYLDNDTGLEAKIVTESPAGQLEQELSDYRDVDGLKVPFSIRTLSNGAVMGQITVDKVELNPTLDDSLFKMPVK